MRVSQIKVGFCGLFLLVSGPALYYQRCDRFRPNNLSPLTIAPPETRIKPQTATIAARVEHLDRLSVSNISGAKELSQIHFVDQDHGWVCSKEAIYKTMNGGGTWLRLNLTVPEHSYISALVFTDETTGWLSMVKKTDAFRFGHRYSSSLFRTRNGGDTWTEQAVYENDVEIKKLRFLNQDIGMVTGDKLTADAPAYPQLFVLDTIDGGKTWSDLSQTVNSVIRNKYGTANDLGGDVYWASPARIFLLTPLGKIVVSSDAGRTWQTRTQFPEIDDYKTTYRKIQLTPSGKIRILGGLNGDEGIWGDLTFEDEQGLWRRYQLGGVDLSDAISRSENEIIVCGGKVHVGSRNRLGPLFGVILRSRDAGKTWSVIYESPMDETFISLTQFDSNRYYALSDSGTLVKFTLSE